MTDTITIPGVATLPADQVRVTTLGSTGLVQYELSANDALSCGFLAEVAEAGQRWFAEWATLNPTERVYVYALGGLHAGFIWGEEASIETLSEFVREADGIGEVIWAELLDISFCAEAHRALVEAAPSRAALAAALSNLLVYAANTGTNTGTEQDHAAVKNARALLATIPA